MTVKPLRLPGLLLIEPSVLGDSRGFFVETYHQERYQSAEIGCKFLQDNHSRSVKHTLRGMHFQSSPGQAKLVRCAVGRIFDVAVDIRPESSTFGQHQGVYLDGESHHQLFVPVGFAHGFCVVSDEAHVLYKVSSAYDAAREKGFAYNDPDINIQWPTDAPILSERDKKAPRLQDISEEDLRAHRNL